MDLRNYLKRFMFFNTYIRQPFQEQGTNINHEKKFYFIHIAKNGGSSIRKALGLDMDAQKAICRYRS